MRKPALLVAVALAVLALPEPGAAAAEAVTSRFVADSAYAGARSAFWAFDSAKRTFFDLDGDGTREIVAMNDNGVVYVLGAEGRVLAELTVEQPPGWGARDINDVAVGDVDGNGRIDVVVATSVGRVAVFELLAAQPDVGRLRFDKRWERQLDPREANPNVVADRPGYDWTVPFPGMDGGPYLADADGDGRLEIFVQTDNQPGFFALRHDGSLRWAVDWSDGNAGPYVDDVDGDGSLEAIFASDGGGVFVFDAARGYAKGTFQAKRAPGACAAAPGSISVGPAVVDLDGDGAKEILVASRQANGTEADARGDAWRRAQDARIYALAVDGTMRWCFTADWLNPMVYMRPAVVDVDGDGRREAIYLDWNTIGHQPGAWQNIDPAHVFALDGRGALVWKRDVTVPWSNKDLAVADVDGDGAQEILVPAHRGAGEGLLLLSLAGTEKGFVPVEAGWGVSRGPQVVDLDGDGLLEIVVPLMRPGDACGRAVDVGCREGALQVFATKGREAAFGGNLLFNHEYERAYDGASPRRVEPPAKTDLPAHGTLVGRAAAPSGGVAGAEIVAERDGARLATRTGPGGAFALHLAPGEWRVTASAPGVETRGRITVSDGGTTTWNPAFDRDPANGLLAFLPGPGWAAAALLAAGAAFLHRRSGENR